MGGSWNRYNSDERLASRFKKVSFRAKNSQQGQSQLLVILNSNGLPEIDLCSVRERERQKENTYHVSLWGRCSLWCKKGSETLVRDNLLSLPPFAFCLSYLHSVLPFSLFELSVQTYLSLSFSLFRSSTSEGADKSRLSSSFLLLSTKPLAKLSSFFRFENQLAADSVSM